MIKITLDPPETENVSTCESIDSKKLHDCAHRAPPSPAKPRSSDDRPLQIFAVAPDLEGKERNLALVIHQMLELGLLLIEKALDKEYPVTPAET